MPGKSPHLDTLGTFLIPHWDTPVFRYFLATTRIFWGPKNTATRIRRGLGDTLRPRVELSPCGCPEVTLFQEQHRIPFLNEAGFLGGLRALLPNTLFNEF